MNNTIQTLLSDYPVVTDIVVAWGDMDAQQHVNNTVYFRYFETARIVYFDRLGLHEFRQSSGIGPILHSTQCRFRIPLTYPDTISVGVRVPEVLDDRFHVEMKVVSHQHQKVAAEGGGIIVAYNYQELQKAVWPSELKVRIAALEDRSRI